MMKYVPCALVALSLLWPLHAVASPAVQGASTYEATSSHAPSVRDLLPEPGSTLKAFFPRFSARVQTHGAPLRGQSIHLYVDGRDVTPAATVNGSTITYVPQERMRAGWHDVFLEGSDSASNAFSQAWVFRSQNPDIDIPTGGDGSFAFVPVGLHSRFSHFFLISPFDGVGLLQLCGFEIPLHRATGTPVFFVTVPLTLGTVLLNCNPGLAFTPFQAGIGVLSPIFFPIEIAGPGFFEHGPIHRRRPLTGITPMPIYRTTTTPMYRTTPTMPIYRSTGTPIYRAMPTMPIYRTTTPPIYRTTTVPNFPMTSRPAIPLRASAPLPAGASMPAVSIPQPYIPH